MEKQFDSRNFLFMEMKASYFKGKALDLTFNNTYRCRNDQKCLDDDVELIRNARTTAMRNLINLKINKS